MIDMRDYYPETVSTSSEKPVIALKNKVFPADYKAIGLMQLGSGQSAEILWMWGVRKKYEYVEMLDGYRGEPTLAERIQKGWEVVAYADDPAYGGTRYTLRRELPYQPVSDEPSEES